MTNKSETQSYAQGKGKKKKSEEGGGEEEKREEGEERTEILSLALPVCKRVSKSLGNIYPHCALPVRTSFFRFSMELQL